MAWGKCPICEERDELDPTKFMSHRCKPHWLVRLQDRWADNSSWRDIYARDAEAAAEAFADDYDCTSGDYPILQHGPYIVLVKDPATGRSQAYSVDGESVPQYSAMRFNEMKDRIEPREVHRAWKRKMGRSNVA